MKRGAQARYQVIFLHTCTFMGTRALRQGDDTMSMRDGGDVCELCCNMPHVEKLSVCDKCLLLLSL